LGKERVFSSATTLIIELHHPSGQPSPADNLRIIQNCVWQYGLVVLTEYSSY